MANPIQSIQQILSHTNIAKINFQLNEFLITGVRYSVVAQKIFSGRITIDAGNINQSGMQAGMVVAAQYDPDKNKIMLPRDDYGSSDPYEQSVLFHELTHAVCDVFMKKQVLAIDSETVATIAQALYVRLCNDRAAGQFALLIDGPGHLALQLVDKMMTERKDFEKDRRTYVIKLSDIASLREAVAIEWNLTGGKSTIVDTYDGV